MALGPIHGQGLGCDTPRRIYCFNIFHFGIILIGFQKYLDRTTSIMDSEQRNRPGSPPGGGKQMGHKNFSLGWGESSPMDGLDKLKYHPQNSVVLQNRRRFPDRHKDEFRNNPNTLLVEMANTIAIFCYRNHGRWKLYQKIDRCCS